jgi:hypothetical protein
MVNLDEYVNLTGVRMSEAEIEADMDRPVP